MTGRALRRVHVEYVPSIDNVDKNDADRDGNTALKKGAHFRTAAAQYNEYVPLHKLSSRKREQVHADLALVGERLRKNVIRPADDATYRRLREREIALADKLGPASGSLYVAAASKKRKPVDTGTSDVDTFADLATFVNRACTDALVDEFGDDGNAAQHTHEERDTRLYQLPHVVPQNDAAFAARDGGGDFTMQVVRRNEAVLCALYEMAAFDACEAQLDKFKRHYPQQKQCKFGEFVAHFGNQSGLRLFMVYVRRDCPNTLFAAFEMDGLRRYFCLMVFEVAHAEGVGGAASWSLEALEKYAHDITDLQRTAYTFKPCDEWRADADYWALYDILYSKKLQNADATFRYAYYTTCQCVQLTQ